MNLDTRGGLGWLEGFGEMLNRCGLASFGAPGIDVVPSNTGAPTEVTLGLHGKISYLPATTNPIIINALSFIFDLIITLTKIFVNLNLCLLDGYFFMK